MAAMTLTIAPAAADAATRPDGPSVWRSPIPGEDGGEGLQTCIGRAQEMHAAAWTCTGGLLTVTADRQGRATDATYLVTQDETATPAPRRMAPGRDDYDSWCESGTVCGRKINDHTAEVKGNGAYGDNNGVIGSFDIVYRQSLDGKYPRWRSLLDWDSGPEINPGDWTNNCRVNVSGAPDDYCGKNAVNFTTINRAHPRAWWPSGGRYSYNEQQLAGSGKYHDDHEGEFVAFGHTQLFKAGVLHTGRWNKCNARAGCQYYQVPWKP